ncbi:MAG TPA: peptidoglycan-binding domain-containing protein [Bryobacteraceae bacterium]|jgi:murein L,D-transpeptidase YcbB/YkuD|nr:peptidoglycan-binding domain-containing protein [Bryobacteraceae bacterium]
MRNFLAMAAAVSMLAAAATGATNPTAKKKTATAEQKSATVHKAAGAKSTPSANAKTGTAGTHKSGTTAANRKRHTPPVTRATWRTRQLAPTSDRYREIQQALAAKGYLQAEQATGAWDNDSIEALKRFQAEQNLDATGKINSLSLIALGLGPRHDAMPTQVAAPEEQGQQGRE